MIHSLLRRLGLLLSVSFTLFISQPLFSQNAIVSENLLPGNPASEWDISGAGDLSIQGFATDISVNRGNPVHFKINVTDGASYTVRIYRLGYYQGLGARLISDLGSFTGIVQPAPVTDPVSGLVDCGNWSVAASWNIPPTATPGVYLARLTRTGNGGASHIVFIVRDDNSTADILFQTSDATWQAYNVYGGYSLYTGSTAYPGGHAVKVSYNRPFLTRGGGGGSGSSEDWLFNAEYPMIRWLERNGYDLNYATNVDAARNPALMNPHKIFLSVGHDEYWSKEQRDHITAARNSGKHLAFFSGNEVYWKTRWENSVAGPVSSFRTLVCYKEGSMGENGCGSKCDPSPAWTGLWRDGCPPAYTGTGACAPENALTGQISWHEASAAIQVPSAYRNLRFWRNTSIAGLSSGQTATLSGNTMGYEFDYEQPNGHYPPGRQRLSLTNVSGRTHQLSLYRHHAGAWVFGAGTVQWSWGLDGVHDRGSSTEDPRMQQATVNLFADMGAQPGSLQNNLVAASASNDHTPPVTQILNPAPSATVFAGLPLVISGTATDNGTVAGTEVSADGGNTWTPASGMGSWSFTYTPTTAGPLTLLCRSFDDNGNMETPVSLTLQVTQVPPPGDGPGGPVLVLSKSSHPFSIYPAELLRSAGLNAFKVLDISTVSLPVLNQYDVIVLGEFPVTPADVSLLTSWVQAGGTLLALRPDPALDGLFGITHTGNTLADKYLLFQTGSGPASGLVNQTIQYHGTADLCQLAGASALATLYSDASTPTVYPAVTTHTVGSQGGRAVAFTYDLARSVVYTRQGNPAWAGDERDGNPGIRSNDLFYGAKAGDVQPDWIDFNKIAIPQADEQIHLLANLIIQYNLPRKPLPRFWFLPRGLKAAVVMTGDDHGNNGTEGRFNQYLALSGSQTAAQVADWQAIRGSSYLYPNTPLSPAQALAFESQGFEIGLHTNTGCTISWTPASFEADLISQKNQLAAAFPGIPAPSTHRTHCIAWSDWSSAAEIQARQGIRLDVNYYYWPASWVQDRPGMFTGSGMPMRFARQDGSLIDCYQVPTQMTDESGITYAPFISALLDKATGPEGYYGVFCANMHTDATSSAGSDAIIAAAQARQIPVISARQLLQWLDGRNQSYYSNLARTGGLLSFDITNNAEPHQLQAMLPMVSEQGNLAWLKRNNQPISFTVQTVKGIAYAFFDAQDGSYQANYVLCSAPTAVVAANSPVCQGQPVALTLQSATGQAPYTLVVNGQTYTGVNPGQTFATISTTEISAFGNTISSPVPPTFQDGPSIELGVRFRSSINGYVTGIRFYKGPTNSGTHTGTLWNSSGTALATATFTNESPSGWQEVRFSSPVAIQANTTYIASYFSPNGYYSFTGNYFTSSGVTNGPLTLLAAGVDGNNGVFNYPGAGFPTSSFNNANYWVDVLFSEVLPGNNSLTFALTSVTDQLNCNQTGSPIQNLTVNLAPPPAGTLSAQGACAGQNINLVFNSTQGTGPFTLQINGNSYPNISNGTAFSSGVTAPASSPVSIWNNSTLGGEPTTIDNDAVELGVKFRSSVPGTVAGVRFYKRSQQPDNVTYTGRLWTSTGTLLGTCTFSAVSGSGWKQASFASPIAIQANTTYIVSYHTPNGAYAFTQNGFTGNSVTNGPLTALASGTDGPNGVYKYGNGGVFPNESFNDANYWVDVVFNGNGTTNFELTGISDVNNCSRTGSLQNLQVPTNLCSPLPVNWLRLTATGYQRQVLLQWTTAQETDNRGFEVQRSTDGQQWQAIGFVDGAGTTTSPRDYQYTDPNLSPARYYYRLKQTDFNGQFRYSSVMVVTLSQRTGYSLEQNLPNPMQDNTLIRFSIPAAEPVTLYLSDAQGRRLQYLVNEVRNAGQHVLTVNLGHLPAGIYFYTLEAGRYRATRKLIIR